MMITEAHLKELGVTSINAKKYIKPLNDAMVKYGINTPLEIAHFLSQILHESGRLVYTKEIADGSVYEGRKDLGNIVKGDGIRFAGRGSLQITGRSNYTSYGNYINKDVVNHPELLEQPELAVDSACWFWCIFVKRNGLSLNDMANKDWFFKITYHVNGAFRNCHDRLRLLKLSYTLFGVDNPEKRIQYLYDYVKGVVVNPNRNKGLEATVFKFIPNISELNKLFKDLL